jgi:hypothetical protein
MKHKMEKPIVLIAPDEELPHEIPHNVRMAKSIHEAESVCGLSIGEEYVEFRRYIGLQTTGSRPWVVMINQGDHQVIGLAFSTLQLAIQAIA